MVGTLVMAPKSVTFQRHDHLVSVLFGDLLSHSYNIAFSMFLYLVYGIAVGSNLTSVPLQCTVSTQKFNQPLTSKKEAHVHTVSQRESRAHILETCGLSQEFLKSVVSSVRYEVWFL